MALKKKMFDMCILPILAYGSQTWSMTKKNATRIQQTQVAIERRMTGVTRLDKIRNTVTRERTQVIDAVGQATKLKYKWAGHIARSNDGRWTNELTWWYPRDGRRKRGRQRKRWRDALPKKWNREAQDRIRWRIVCRNAGEAHRLQRPPGLQ